MEKFVKIMVVVNVLIVIHMITGCDKTPQGPRVQASDSQTFEVITINKCEYLNCWTYGGNYVLCHKGDCKNPIHVYARKEEEEQNEVKKNREEKRRKK